jgi:hypothetical protein
MKHQDAAEGHLDGGRLRANCPAEFDRQGLDHGDGLLLRCAIQTRTLSGLMIQ